MSDPSANLKSPIRKGQKMLNQELLEEVIAEMSKAYAIALTPTELLVAEIAIRKYAEKISWKKNG